MLNIDRILNFDTIDNINTTKDGHDHFLEIRRLHIDQ